MASVYESSESAKQEEQDYVYGVVPKEWCTVSKHGPNRVPKEGEWLTYIPRGTKNKYQFVLYHVDKTKGNETEVTVAWKTLQGTKRINCKDGYFQKEISLIPKEGWFPITEDMAVRMKILHGF